MVPSTVKGISMALIVAIAIASGIAGALIGGWILNTGTVKGNELGSYSRSIESLPNFMGIDQEGFYTFRKFTSWRATTLMTGGKELSGSEISIGEVSFMFAHLGTALFRVPSPGLYTFYYSITPPDPDDSYLDLRYLQVIIMKPDAIKPDGTVDISKILTWEIYKYERVVKVQFYADTSGIYMAVFGPADGSVITLKAYKSGTPIHNVLKLKVVSSTDPNVKGEILSAEELDLIITKINNFIVMEKVLHEHRH
ncbi:MAG: hypothetical protein QXW41_07595 [Fervidicoccaceae archaeon]